MSQAEVKEAIIERVQSATDDGLLTKVFGLLEKGRPAPLSEAQRAAIAEGKAQIAAGDYLTHDEVVAEELV